MAGQPRQALEHELIAVTVDDRELGPVADRFEEPAIVRLAELGVFLLGVMSPAGRLDRVEDAGDALGEGPVDKPHQRFGDRIERAAHGPGRSRRSAFRRPPDSFRASDRGENSVGTTGASPMRLSNPILMMISSCWA